MREPLKMSREGEIKGMNLDKTKAALRFMLERAEQGEFDPSHMAVALAEWCRDSHLHFIEFDGDSMKVTVRIKKAFRLHSHPSPLRVPSESSERLDTCLPS